MRNVLLYLWQLPQNLLGLVCVHILHAHKSEIGFYRFNSSTLSSVSLGNYILMNNTQIDNVSNIRHEYGHQRQSKLLGWFYMLIIGLPSVIGNLLHRLIKFDYYKQPWESWADRLGGVER